MSKDRPPFDPRQIRERAKKAMAVHGLAAKHIVGSMIHGAVFTASDSAIDFPESRLPGAGARTAHAFRRVILVQAQGFLKSVNPKTVLVVPVTSSISETAQLQPYEVEIPGDEPGFDAGRKVALVHLLQPILKSDLAVAKGTLRGTTLTSLMQAIVRMLGITSATDVSLPPRPQQATEQPK